MHTTAAKTGAQAINGHTGLAVDGNGPVAHAKSSIETPQQVPLWAGGPLSAVQFSLKVNEPGDKYEREADRVAGQIIRRHAPEAQRTSCACGRPAGPDGMCDACEHKQEALQRQASGDAQTTAPPIVQTTLQRPGRPLDSATRYFMESHFGHDFGQIRVHSDAVAASSAEAVGARAYAVGSDLVFNAGEYQPATAAGRKLLAHELTHSLQQGAGLALQRAPLSPYAMDSGTAGLHEHLVGEYAAATGSEPEPGAQYTLGYEAWLAGEADKHRFQPPKVVRSNPLDRLSNGQIAAHTFLTINGVNIAFGLSIGALQQQYVNAITPATVTSTPEGSGVSCRFADDFQIQSSAEIVINTAPGRNGWQKTMNPIAVLQPVDQPRCAGQSAVPVTLHGQPSDQDYATIIENAEREHVKALEGLHNKHFVPYYFFVHGLRANGANAGDCASSLRQQIGKRADQAALGFIFGDLAETARFDDPNVGTHHSSIIPTIDPNCKSITLIAGQTRPQQPGLAPGNVRTVAPTTTAIDPSKLSVNGNDLVQSGNTLRSFSSPANASLALQVFQQYGITEIVRLGTFEFLLANGSALSGTLPGPSERNIDPDYYEVTFGVTGQSNWSIVEVVGDQVNLIHDFGANRDRAYSAVALMQQHGFNREVWIGPANNQELHYFRKD